MSNVSLLLLTPSSARLTEPFSKGIVVNLQLRNLQTQAYRCYHNTTVSSCCSLYTTLERLSPPSTVHDGTVMFKFLLIRLFGLETCFLLSAMNLAPEINVMYLCLYVGYVWM